MRLGGGEVECRVVRRGWPVPMGMMERGGNASEVDLGGEKGLGEGERISLGSM